MEIELHILRCLSWVFPFAAALKCFLFTSYFADTDLFRFIVTFLTNQIVMWAGH